MAVSSGSASPPQQQPASSLSFTQGFLLGQISIALLIFAFIKFFIFGEADPPDVRASQRAEARHQRTISHRRTVSTTTNLLRHKRSSLLSTRPTATNFQPPSSGAILAKTYYNVAGHQPESLDWFNVLIAQTIAQLRADALQDDAVAKSLTAILNGGSKPEYVGEIRVTEITLGEEFPIFSNCRVIPVQEGGMGSSADGVAGGVSGAGTTASPVHRLQARMDVDLSDVITLGVETKLVLNYPKPFVAVLPVALAVSVVRFSGTLTVSFIPSSTQSESDDLTGIVSEDNGRSSQAKTSSTASPTTLAFTFLDDYRLDLSVRSLVGSRSRLQDVPKIAQLVESRIHAWFDERCVEPRFQQIVLPSLWPRKKNTRGGEEPRPGSAGDGSGYAESPTTVVEDEAVVDPMDNATPSFEARMRAEGVKIREAEEKARKADRERYAGLRRRGMTRDENFGRRPMSSGSVMPGTMED